MKLLTEQELLMYALGPEGAECVHTSHCCVLHGCKYCDWDCPVVNKVSRQDYLCEDCGGHYDNKPIKDLIELAHKVIEKEYEDVYLRTPVAKRPTNSPVYYKILL